MAHYIFGSLEIANRAPLEQGVSFFFVLSGFILAWNYPVLTNWADRRKFWLARFARIWPLHLVTCVLWIALVFNFDRASNFPGIDGLLKLATNLLLLQVWIPQHNWVLSFNGVAWSISTEFFFYAMFPLLIALWKKRWHQLMLIQALVIFSVLVFNTLHAVPGAEDHSDYNLMELLSFHPIIRIFEFSIGIALSQLVEKLAAAKIQLNNFQWLTIECAALLVAVVSMLVAANPIGLRQTLGVPAGIYFSKDGLSLIWGLLIGVFALSRGPLTRFLSLRFAVFLGEISFALYLSHAIVIHYVEIYAERIQSYGAIGYGAFWASCLMLAATLFLGIETPFRKFILMIASKKTVAPSLQACFRAKELTALSLLLCFALAMFYVKPSTIVKLDQTSAVAFMQPSAQSVQIPSGANFDGRYEIAGMRVHAAEGDIVTIEVLLRAAKDMSANDVLALHVNDASGQLIANDDQKLDAGRATIPAGTYWIQKFHINRAATERAASFGLAMYNNPTSLFDCAGGNRDWGGKRLILPIKR